MQGRAEITYFLELINCNSVLCYLILTVIFSLLQQSFQLLPFITTVTSGEKRDILRTRERDEKTISYFWPLFISSVYQSNDVEIWEPGD